MTPIQELFKTLRFISNADGLSAEQVKTLLPILATEKNLREEKRIKYLLHRSGLRPIKNVESFDWKFNPKLPKEELLEMVGTDWNKEVRNYLLIGPTGVGKSHMANSACYQAIRRGTPAAFITCSDLVGKLENSRNKSATIEYYASLKLLCIDEIGYVFPKKDECDGIFQIIAKRSELTSTIVTTNLFPSDWNTVFPAATASAILDRLSFNGKFLTCEGDTYRRKRK